jgi:hypothetical protein
VRLLTAGASPMRMRASAVSVMATVWPEGTQSLRQDPTAQVGFVAVEEHLGATLGQQGTEP